MFENASVSLEAGVSVRALAEYLGHEDPAVTLGTYAHLLPESPDRSRPAINNAFQRMIAVADGLMTA